MTNQKQLNVHAVLIADDHAVTRRGMKDLVLDTLAVGVVVEAANTDEILEALPDHDWGLILLDLRMPGIGIVETIRRIRERLSAVPVLVVTAVTEVEYVVEVMKAGATGFVEKSRSDDELATALREVALGKPYLHPDTAQQTAAVVWGPTASQPHHSLSDREMAVFICIAKGLSVKDIAADLHISDKTVATYLARIRTKTGISSHVEIARYAIHNKLVD